MMDYLLTRHEERFNVLTHGLMAALVLASSPFVVIHAYNTTPAMPMTAAVSVGVFCLCLLLMFTASSVYHGLPNESRYKRIFNRFDHMAIFFAIAGSYTPLALVVIGSSSGMALLILEWSLVVAGIIYKSFVFRRNKLTAILSPLIYLLMGWAVVFVFPEFISKANPICVALIIAGGLLYSGGIAFYASKRENMHLIWHLFVNGGAICHFVAIVFFLQR